MAIELSALVPHMPSICHEDQAPEYQVEVVKAMKI